MSYKVFQLVCVVDIAHFTRRGPDAWRIMALTFVLRILIPLKGFLEYVHVPGPWSTVFGTWSWNDLYEFMHLSTTVLIHATAPVSMTTVCCHTNLPNLFGWKKFIVSLNDEI